MITSKTCVARRLYEMMLMKEKNRPEVEEEGRGYSITKCLQPFLCLQAEVLRVFILHGFNIALSDDDGTTPLDLAKQNGHDDCIAVLTDDTLLTLQKTDLNLLV